MNFLDDSLDVPEDHDVSANQSHLEKLENIERALFGSPGDRSEPKCTERFDVDQIERFAKVVCDTRYKSQITDILGGLSKAKLLKFADVLLSLVAADAPGDVPVPRVEFLVKIEKLFMPEKQVIAASGLENSDNLQLEYGTRNRSVTLTKPMDQKVRSVTKRCNAYSKKVHTLPNTVWAWNGSLYFMKFNKPVVPKPPDQWFFGGGGKRDDDNCTIHIPSTLKVPGTNTLSVYAGKTISANKISWEQFLFLAGQMLYRNRKQKQPVEVDKALKFWMDVVTENAVSHGKRYGPSRIRKEQRRELLDAWIQIHIFCNNEYHEVLDYYLRAGYVVNITQKRGWTQHKTICLTGISAAKKRKRSAK